MLDLADSDDGWDDGDSTDTLAQADQATFATVQSEYPEPLR